MSTLNDTIENRLSVYTLGQAPELARLTSPSLPPCRLISSVAYFYWIHYQRPGTRPSVTCVVYVQSVRGRHTLTRPVGVNTAGRSWGCGGGACFPSSLTAEECCNILTGNPLPLFCCTLHTNTSLVFQLTCPSAGEVSPHVELCACPQGHRHTGSPDWGTQHPVSVYRIELGSGSLVHGQGLRSS